MGNLCRIVCFDYASQSSTSGKLTGYCGLGWSTGSYDVLKDAIDGILVENSYISVGMNVHFESLKLEAILVWLVAKGDSSEVRQVGLRTYGCVLWYDDCNFVSLVLTGECFNVGQGSGDSTLGVPFVVSQPCCCSRGLLFFITFRCHPFTPPSCYQTCFIHSNWPSSFNLL